MTLPSSIKSLSTRVCPFCGRAYIGHATGKVSSCLNFKCLRDAKRARLGLPGPKAAHQPQPQPTPGPARYNRRGAGKRTLDQVKAESVLDTMARREEAAQAALDKHREPGTITTCDECGRLYQRQHHLPGWRIDAATGAATCPRCQE